VFRNCVVSLALTLLALGCSDESPVEPVTFEASVRVSGNIAWSDCSPAAGVSVVLDEVECKGTPWSRDFDIDCDTWVHGRDVTDADGRYDIEASVVCPALLRLRHLSDRGTSKIFDHNIVDCRQGDHQVNLVIGDQSESREPERCLPDP